MSLEKKQVPQLIVLGVLVVGCVGVVSFQLSAGKRAAPKAKPTAIAKAQVDKAAGESTAKNEESDATKMAMAIPDVFPNLGTAPARRDPFKPAALSGGILPEPPSRPRPAASQQPRTTVNPTSSGALPVNPFRNMGQGSGTSVIPAPTNVAPVEPDPQFTLTGVIRGEQDVAIIRSGQNGRYVVRQGQLIEGRYKVLSISDTGAVLAYKNRRIHVKLGGVKNAS